MRIVAVITCWLKFYHLHVATHIGTFLVTLLPQIKCDDS